MKIIIFIAACLMAVLIAPSPSLSAESGIKLGILKCHQIKGSSVNFLVHSTAQITCLFTSAGGAREAIYQGKTGIGLGIDLNWNKSETIAFVVFGATTDIAGSHPLAGKYIGGRVSASAVIGAGVQVLVGSGDNQFTLQPLAIERSTGFGVAAGMGYLYLEAAK